MEQFELNIEGSIDYLVTTQKRLEKSRMSIEVKRILDLYFDETMEKITDFFEVESFEKWTWLHFSKIPWAINFFLFCGQPIRYIRVEIEDERIENIMEDIKNLGAHVLHSFIRNNDIIIFVTCANRRVLTRLRKYYQVNQPLSSWQKENGTYGLPKL